MKGGGTTARLESGKPLWLEYNPRNYLEDETEVSFVPMTLISADYSINPSFETRKWKEVKSGFTHFKEDDVVLAKITPCFENSKAGLMKGLTNGFGAGTTELHVFRGERDVVLPEYVYIYFKSPNFLQNGEAKMTGSAGQKRVPKGYVALPAASCAACRSSSPQPVLLPASGRP